MWAASPLAGARNGDMESLLGGAALHSYSSSAIKLGALVHDLKVGVCCFEQGVGFQRAEEHQVKTQAQMIAEQIGAGGEVFSPYTW